MSNLLGGGDNLEDRLQRIEQALLKKDSEESSSSQASDNSISPPVPDISSITTSFDRSQKDLPLSLLTPSTKERTAKSFLLAGKEQEQRGQLTNALALYENAYGLLPDKNSRLASKIKKLKSLIEQSKPSSSHQSEQYKKVLTLINNGTVDELSELHMIAAKRAKLIVGARPFNTIKDLEKVHGFGKRFVEKFYALNVPDEAELF